jgi:hypothetical protein
MNQSTALLDVRTGFALCFVFLGAFTGCASHKQARNAGMYAEPRGVYEERAVVVQPEYVYYPDYQVYYNRGTRQYVYLEGNSWISSPTPPFVSVDALLGSPSVRLAFHDSPANHHATVVRQYPKHWRPPTRPIQTSNKGHMVSDVVINNMTIDTALSKS